MATRYNVYLTPLLQSGSYGTEIDVTNYVLNSGIKTIKKYNRRRRL